MVITWRLVKTQVVLPHLLKRGGGLGICISNEFPGVALAVVWAPPFENCSYVVLPLLDELRSVGCQC